MMNPDDDGMPIMPEESPEPESRLFDHVLAAWNKMYEDSTQQEWNGKTVILWQGRNTQLLDDLSISRGNYGGVFNSLVGMGCIVKLVRGGGPTLTKYQLVKRPEINDFLYARRNKSTMHQSNRASTNVLAREINTRVAKVEAAMTEMYGFVRSLEHEVRTLKLATQKTMTFDDLDALEAVKKTAVNPPQYNYDDDDEYGED